MFFKEEDDVDPNVEETNNVQISANTSLYDPENFNSLINCLNTDDFDQFSAAYNELTKFICSEKGVPEICITNQNLAELIHLILISETIPEKTVYIIELVDILLKNVIPSMNLIEIFPKNIFDDILTLICSTNNLSILGACLSTLIYTVSQFKSIVTYFAENDFVSKISSIETNFDDQTLQSKDAEFANVESKFLSFYSVFFERRQEVFQIDFIFYLYQRCFTFIRDNTMDQLTHQSLVLLYSLASANISDFIEQISSIDEEQSLLLLLKNNNSEICNYTLKIVYLVTMENPKYFNLEMLQENIQKHLVKRGENANIENICIACDIVAIYLTFPELHSNFGYCGIVSQLINLIKDQAADVQAKAAIALSKMICSGNLEIVDYIFSNYSIIKPLMTLFENENENLQYSLLNSFIRILDLALIENSHLLKTANLIVNEINIDIIEELAEEDDSKCFDLAHLFLEKIET